MPSGGRCASEGLYRRYDYRSFYFERERKLTDPSVCSLTWEKKGKDRACKTDSRLLGLLIGQSPDCVSDGAECQ